MLHFLTILTILSIPLQTRGVPQTIPSYCPNVTDISLSPSSPLTNPKTQFDDLPENPRGFSPSQDPVGTYKGTYPYPPHPTPLTLPSPPPTPAIYYRGFTIATQKNSPQKFFHIPSPPNIINSNTLTQSLFGGTSALILNTTTTSTHTTFTLFSTRLACLVTNGESTSNANGCTVLFVGNKPRGRKSVVYEYEFPNQNWGGAAGGVWGGGAAEGVSGAEGGGFDVDGGAEWGGGGGGFVG